MQKELEDLNKDINDLKKSIYEVIEPPCRKIIAQLLKVFKTEKRLSIFLRVSLFLVLAFWIIGPYYLDI